MQNPGSDAGVFVWAGGAHGRYCAVNADVRCNVTLKKGLHARRDTPVMHTRGRYTMACVDNFKK
jgi:hypothetical protein